MSTLLGFCSCGCGERTSLAPRTSARKRWIEGQPLRFIRGHQTRIHRSNIPTPSDGFCTCGCGGKTALIPETDSKRGLYKGQPRRFLVGHRSRLNNPGHRVDPITGCWQWLGYIHRKTGYPGMMVFQGRSMSAHRAYFLKHKGSIPQHWTLDHLCRNRACVNPEHLEAVTHAVNNRRGYATRLDENQVAEIRLMLSKDRRRGAIVAAARHFSISHSLVSMIAAGRRWA